MLYNNNTNNTNNDCFTMMSFGNTLKKLNYMQSTVVRVKMKQWLSNEISFIFYQGCRYFIRPTCVAIFELA